MTRDQVATATGLVDTFELETPRGVWFVTLTDALPGHSGEVELVFSFQGPQRGDVRLHVAEDEATSERALRAALRDILARDPLPPEVNLSQL